MAVELVELRLPVFKSIRDAVVRFDDLTLLVGRNGSGKSNVLDGLAVLSALSAGGNIRDALDGGRDGPIVRGGSEGCAPVGQSTFALGSTTRIDDREYHLDVEIVVSPTVQIVSERLWTERINGPKRGEPQDLLKTDPPQPESGDIVARWESVKQGRNPPVTFRATQLLTAQIAIRVPATSQAGRHVREIASSVLASLASVFILDPVPHQMREFVPEKDLLLRRSADNLSAVLAKLLREESSRETLVDMTRSLSEAQIGDVTTVSSDLGDVMATVNERLGGEMRPMPARLMSDGTLRFLAIAAALLDVGAETGAGPDVDDVPSRLLVIEELENGLHPSQVSLLLDRLQVAARDNGVRTFATTHGPAILDALPGAAHDGVVVCHRSEEGWTAVTKLTDFPDYFQVIGRSPLDGAAIKDRLRPSLPLAAPTVRLPMSWDCQCHGPEGRLRRHLDLEMSSRDGRPRPSAGSC